MNPSPARLQALLRSRHPYIFISSYPSQRVSAGDLDNLTGHPSGLLACEQHDDVCDIGWRAEAAQRNGRQELLLHFGRDVAGLYGTWRDGVDRNAEGTQLARHAACQGLERELGSAIANLRRECARRIGADVND